MDFASVLPRPFWIALFAVTGAVFGSFANVLIYRMQEEPPLRLFGRSRCRSCSCPIPFYLNIPVFSYLFLRGRCRECKAPFSVRYLAVEALCAVLFALIFTAVGFKWFLLEALIFAFGLVAASGIDADQMILPDSFTVSGTVLGLLGGLLNPERAFWEAFWGASAGGLIFWATGRLYWEIRKKEGMGLGDVKLAAWTGAVLGWKILPFVVFFSSFLGMLAGLWLTFFKKRSFDAPLPFGPFLSFSALIGLLLQEFKADLPLFFLFIR